MTQPKPELTDEVEQPSCQPDAETLPIPDDRRELSGDTTLGPAVAADVGNEPTDAPMQLFGDYELLSEIARGGMGVVYKARQRKANRIVALKMILSGGLADAEEIRRFYVEAEAAANLDHPHIVPVFDVGCEGKQHYFSMGFVDGGSLAREALNGPLEPKRAAEIMIIVSEAIAYAHGKQIIHRDLKPANILLDRNRIPRVTDFGLAKRINRDSNLTASGQILGTPSYMSPEQASGVNDQIGPATDVYSLGAILYFLLTGRPPFQAAQVWDTILQVLEREPVPPRQLNPAIDLDLETIVLKALQKDAVKRYLSAQDLADDLSRYLARRPILARPTSTSERAYRWAQRNKAVALLSASLLIGLIVATIGSLTVAVTMYDMAKSESKLRTDADQARGKAEAAEAEMRENLYLTEMKVGVDVANSTSGIRQLDEIVDHWVPKESEKDLRGWEWHWLASITDREAKVIRAIPEHWDRGAVPSVDFSPDGTLIAWSISHEITVATAGDISIVARFQADTGKDVYCVRFSNDGSRVAACGMDQTARVWDIKSQRLLWDQKLPAAIGAICWSPDDRLVAFQTNFVNPASIHIVDLDRREEIKTLEVDLDGHLRSIGFSPDGQWFASAGFIPLTDHFLNVWETGSWDLRHSKLMHRQHIYAIAWSSDSNRIASASMDGSVKVWDFQRDELQSLTEGGLGKTSVAWGPGDKSVVAGCRDFSTTLWDAREGTEIDVLRGHTAVVNAAAWNGKNSMIATTGDDGFVRMWDMSRAPPVRSLKQNKTSIWHDGAYVTWSPDGSRIAAANNQPFTIWDAVSGAPLFLHTAPDNGIGYTQLGGQPSWSSDGQHLVSGWRDEITIWNGEGKEALHTLPAPNGLMYQTFSPAKDDHRLVLTRMASEAATAILIYDSRDNEAPREITQVPGKLTHLAWSLAGDRISIIADHRRITTIDSTTGAQLAEQTFDVPIESLAWSPDGTQLVTGSRDQTATIRDAGTFRSVRELRGHTSTVWAVSWSPDGMRIATGSGDNTVRLWDAENGKATIILKHDDEVKSVAWSPEGRRLASMSKDAIVKVWDASRGYRSN